MAEVDAICVVTSARGRWRRADRGTMVLALPGVARAGQMLLHNHPERAPRAVRGRPRRWPPACTTAASDSASSTTRRSASTWWSRCRGNARRSGSIPTRWSRRSASTAPWRACSANTRTGRASATWRRTSPTATTTAGCWCWKRVPASASRSPIWCPRSAWSRANGERTIVSTNTINLQEQLVGKDLPMLREALAADGWAPKFALLKGWRNYLCLSRLQHATGAQQSLLEPERQDELVSLAEWASRTADGTLGDLAVQPSSEVWDEICAEADLCTRRAVPLLRPVLPVQGAAPRRRGRHRGGQPPPPRRRPGRPAGLGQLGGSGRAAALQAADPRRGPSPRGRGGLAPRHPGHEPGRAAAAGSVRAEPEGAGPVARHGALRTRRPAQPGQPRPHPRTAAPGHRRRPARGRPALSPAARPGGRRWRRPAPPDGGVRQGRGMGRRAPDGARRAALQLSTRSRRRSRRSPTGWRRWNPTERGDQLLLEMRAVVRRLEAASDGLNRTLRPPAGGAPDRPVDRTLGRQAPAHASSRRCPLDLAPVLRHLLFDRLETVILTSATLAAGGEFEFLERRLGLSEAPSPVTTREVFASPFDYPSQCLFGIPDDFPDPREDEAAHDAALAQAVTRPGARRGRRALRPVHQSRGAPAGRPAAPGHARPALAAARAGGSGAGHAAAPLPRRGQRHPARDRLVLGGGGRAGAGAPRAGALQAALQGSRPSPSRRRGSSGWRRRARTGSWGTCSRTPR